MAVVLIDYVLRLETGESLTVAELDPARVPELSDPDVLAAASPVLDRCTRATRGALESAKLGHSREFEAAMGTPAVGCLLKLERPVCSEIRTCASADPAKCTTKYVDPRRRAAPGKFLPCWEFEVRGAAGAEAAVLARALASAIVSAWRDGKLVVLVEG